MSNASVANATIITNLEALKAAVLAQPDAEFDLSQYRQDRYTCGTLYCTAGLAASMPLFQEQGMGFRPFLGARFMVTVNGSDIRDNDTDTDALFGENAWKRLFAAYGDAEGEDAKEMHKQTSDGYIDWESELFPHKEVAVQRLERQIAAMKGAQA